MKTKKEIYEDAASVIRQYGHRKNGYGSPTLGMCVFGAIRWAMFGNTSIPDAQNNESWNLYWEISAQVDKAAPSTGAVCWNDRDETTGDDVIAFLNGLAASSN